MILSNIVTKVKGEEFAFDARIPLRRIISFGIIKLISLIYGFILLRTVAFVHPTARLLSRSNMKLNGSLNIGKNCLIDGLSTEGLIFGKNVSIHPNTSIECTGSLASIGKGINIGSNVGIGRNCHLGGAGGIKIGNDTILGQYVSVHSENHCFDSPGTKIRLSGVSREGIEIGQNCWLGAKVTILDGARVGDNCVIAAGAVVKSGDYPGNTIYGGVPARKLGIVK